MIVMMAGYVSAVQTWTQPILQNQNLDCSYEIDFDVPWKFYPSSIITDIPYVPSDTFFGEQLFFGIEFSI